MRKLFPLAIVLALFVGVGCDSNDDEGTSDNDRFVGSWTVNSIVNDSDGANEMDLTAGLIGSTGVLNSLSLGFNADGTYTLSADYRAAEATDLVVAGASFTYSVNEQINTLTLQLPFGTSGATVPAPVIYSFNGDGEFTAQIPAAVMNGLFPRQNPNDPPLYQGNVGTRFVKQ